MNQQNTARVIEMQENPLEQYRRIAAELKELEKEREILKNQIYRLMDIRQSDTLSVGGLRAERILSVQERVDSQKVRKLLGGAIHTVLTECEVIKLSVV